MATSEKSRDIKILLIEDNKGDARLIQEMLMEESSAVFSLTTAGTLHEGLEKLAFGRTDVVLSDLSLPDSNRLETLNGILQRVSDMPVVILSGLDDEISAIRAVKEGAQDYLIKGQVTSQLLVRTIKYAIERKKMVSQLIQSKKMESIGHLAAGMAHEINTPIQYISTNIRFVQDSFQQIESLMNGFSGMLHEMGKEPPVCQNVIEFENRLKEIDPQYLFEEVPKAIQHSLYGIRKVSEIVQAIYDFSQVNTDGVKNVDINKSILTTITVAQNEVNQVAEIKTDLCRTLPPIKLLPVEFNQVIFNILFNAVQAVRQVVDINSGEKGVIAVRTLQDEAWVEIHISDTGLGIPMEIRDKVFDPFFTTKEIGEGIGHGLTFAHNVIAKFGGFITFETEDGKGTTFIIKVPKNGIADE